MTPDPYQPWRPHPWHGLEVGPQPPDVVNAYVEITPFDLVKYEIDKRSGFLRVDRPQRTSSTPPTLYGFVPRTLCGTGVAGVADLTQGDGDPLDICVLSERPINRAEVILQVRVLGGLLMEDGGQADDKIVAVLKDDAIWSEARDLVDLPPRLVERLQHYFLTYKMRPGEASSVQVRRIYGVEQARRVVEAAMQDYRVAYPGSAA
ncbi:MAG: inorganic pyrophosphatase [Planctomycetes bacterium]|nr:inorganic pyrophosphatase [Planctomycetota bacterium]